MAILIFELHNIPIDGKLGYAKLVELETEVDVFTILKLNIQISYKEYSFFIVDINKMQICTI